MSIQICQSNSIL